jgi:hypothetical protein
LPQPHTIEVEPLSDLPQVIEHDCVEIGGVGRRETRGQLRDQALERRVVGVGALGCSARSAAVGVNATESLARPPGVGTGRTVPFLH